jgi:phage terminase Nu1 subunit (DNA packaging protein)
MEELLSIRGYATRRGVWPSYIGRLIKSGKIPLTNGKIDPAAADAALARNTRPRPKATEAARHDDAPAKNPVEAGDRGAPIYAEELARLTRAKADAAELENKIKRGLWVERAVIARQNLAIDTIIKKRFEGMGKKLTPLLTNQPARTIAAILEAEIREILSELSSTEEADETTPDL